MSSFLYSSIIQQNIYYFNQLQNEFTDLKVQKESIKTDVENIEIVISNIKIDIEQLSLSKNNIRNIDLVLDPKCSLFPIKPNKKLK